MATIDLSRHATDFRKHYTGVRMQQGRVLTDDDFNEQARIDAEDTRRTRIDVIGPLGSPDDGFLIAAPVIDPVTNRPTFTIKAGSFYLGGQRLTLEADELYHLQKDWLQQGAVSGDRPTLPAGDRFDFAYLETWQQAVSAVEDSELLEVALGGPDTSARVRNLRRVHVLANVTTGDCNDAWAALLASLAGQGTLNSEFELVPDAKLKVEPDGTTATTDLCSPPVAGGYLGAENQAIRVQIVGTNQFTWGFDNAAPLYRVQLGVDSAGQRRRITMKTLPKDQAHWPLIGQTVELLPWSAVLPNGQKIAELHGHLATVTANYNPDTQTFDFDLAPANDASGKLFGETWKERTGPSGDATTLDDEGEFFYLRVWNRGSDSTSTAKIPFVAGTPVSLAHTGLRVTFSGAQLRADDFWIIAARPDAPNIIVPWELSTNRRPHGVRRWLAPLAVIRWPGGNVAGKVVNDCRETFLPLTRIRNCCSVTVGDGNESHGHFTSIQAAVDSLPEKGGRVCVLPGIYRGSIKIVNRHNIEISGCGPRTILRGDPAKEKDVGAPPVLAIIGGHDFALECFAVEAEETGVGVLVLGQNPYSKSESQDALDTVVNVCISDLSVGGGLRSALRARFVRNLTVHRCEFQNLDQACFEPTVLLLADDVLFERNTIEISVEPNANSTFSGAPAPSAFFPGVNARGGLQIEGTSERVRIVENRIRGGSGNGITLGSVRTVTGNESGPPDEIIIIFFPLDPCDSKGEIDIVVIPGGGDSRTVSAGDLDDIYIERNHIHQMGSSGISVDKFFDLAGADEFISVYRLTIKGNLIERCLRRPVAETTPALAPFVGYGGIALADVEDLLVHDNVIRQNGLGPREPCCGIYVLHVEGADFSRNQILDNGMGDTVQGQSPKLGRRGGIAIGFAIAPTRQISLHGVGALATSAPAQTGVAAARIHDNVVTCPLGQALFLNALGPVSVEGNQFTTRGLAPGLASFSFMAATVWIMNLGISNEIFYLQYLLFSLIAKNTPVEPVLPGLDDFTLGRVLANGQVLFSDNMVNTDLFGIGTSFSVSGIYILTLDDLGFHDNQCEANLFLFDDFLISHAILFGLSLRMTNNRLKEGMFNAILSALTLGLFANTTALNQGTHCILAMGGKLQYLGNTAVVGPNPLLNTGDHKFTCDELEKLLQGSLGKAAGGV